MNQKITEEILDMEVKQTIKATYNKDASRRLDMIVNPAKRRIRFDVFTDLEFTSANKPIYSGQSLKQAIKIYNGVGNEDD